MAIDVGDTVTGLQGSYRVLARHGEGSFGITYRASDVASEAQLIVKELRIEKLDDWKALELFEREGRTLASISHPNIPAFRDFFAHGGATPLPVAAMGSYDGPARLSLVLVQEFIEGPTLQQRVDLGQPLAPAQAETVLRSLLSALKYLHEHAPPLIHRDIKPGNVILRPDGQPCLVDFGAIQDRLRSTGSVGSTIVGTLGYMPLEQIRGDARPASDLYALGVTIVVAMAGRALADVPFDDSTGQIAIHRAVPHDTRHALRDTLKAMTAPLLGQRLHSADDALARIEPVRPLPPPPTPPQPIVVPHPVHAVKHGQRSMEQAPPSPDIAPPERENDVRQRPTVISPEVMIGGVAGIAFLVIFFVFAAQRPSRTTSNRATSSSVVGSRPTSAPTSRPAASSDPGAIPSHPDDALAVSATDGSRRRMADRCRTGVAEACLGLGNTYGSDSPARRREGRGTRVHAGAQGVRPGERGRLRLVRRLLSRPGKRLPAGPREGDRLLRAIMSWR